MYQIGEYKAALGTRNVSRLMMSIFGGEEEEADFFWWQKIGVFSKVAYCIARTKTHLLRSYVPSFTLN